MLVGVKGLCELFVVVVLVVVVAAVVVCGNENAKEVGAELLKY